MRCRHNRELKMMAQPYFLEWLTSPFNSSPEIIFDLPNTIGNVANHSAIPLSIGNAALPDRCKDIFAK